MKNNPYSEVVGMFSVENTQADIRIGQVTATNPLTIQLGDLPINNNNKLYLADHLTDLMTGDQLVVVQSADKQTYSVIARVRRV